MRLHNTLILPLLLVGSVCAQDPPAAEKRPVPAPAAPEQRVSIVISATDSKGNPIRDLPKDQVFLFENEKLLPTLEVRDASDLPLHLGLVLLASKRNFDQEQAAAIALAQRFLRPGKDKAFVVAAGGEKPWPNPRINWLTDPSAVEAVVRGLDRNAGLPDAFNYRLESSSAGTSRIAIQTISSEGGFSVFDVIWAMMKSSPEPARRAVVIFRRASAHASGLGIRSVEAVDSNHERVIRAAQALGVAFFTINAEDESALTDTFRSDVGATYSTINPGEGTLARQYDQGLNREMQVQLSVGRRNVERIALESGGRPWWTTKKNFADAVTGIANELAAQYVVSFVPVASGAGPFHPVKVQVSRVPRVSAPRAYFLPVEGKPAP